MSSFFNIKVTLFVVDSFQDVVYVVMHCSHPVKPLFCSGRGEFVVVIGVYGAWIKATETSVGGHFVAGWGCGVVGKFCER